MTCTVRLSRDSDYCICFRRRGCVSSDPFGLIISFKRVVIGLVCWARKRVGFELSGKVDSKRCSMAEREDDVKLIDT
ncbi:hypothetical protein CEXT_736521 [Caerostris extrusa]|uniref:Uncharacterized protein n=1 Tax=Caerostris extrusa TaxID=172846 RepID=A0AAV4SX82_CAEEX|nr:hypothetical protein CEXT_736521 [Caerostris extrusa]